MSIAVRRSCAAYRLLLWAYPPEFRREYGEEMAQVFRDSCQEAVQQHGLAGLAGYWLHILPDLIVTAIVERYAAVDRRSVALLLCAFGCGLLTGYLDFHATEVQPVALVLLVFTAAFGFASPQRAWRWGLTVGLGVPLCHIVSQLLRLPPPNPVEPNVFGSVIALIPALIGAYTGAFARWISMPTV